MREWMKRSGDVQILTGASSQQPGRRMLLRSSPSALFSADQNSSQSSVSSAANKTPIPVKTQRGHVFFKVQIPDDPCPQCGGTTKSTCGECSGKGRINYKDRAMLPKGVWPAWCLACRGTGKWYCHGCMGTGKRRGTIGFRWSDQKDQK